MLNRCGIFSARYCSTSVVTVGAALLTGRGMRMQKRKTEQRNQNEYEICFPSCVGLHNLLESQFKATTTASPYPPCYALLFKNGRYDEIYFTMAESPASEMCGNDPHDALACFPLMMSIITHYIE